MFLDNMKHSPVRNYGGIPGLTSWLIGEPSKRGLIRLMECSRDHFEPIVPHSHRFDFECRVLRGKVRNVIWTPDPKGDEYEATELRYTGTPGHYEKSPSSRNAWSFRADAYREGDTYSMDSTEVHSIFFARDTVVLFFEGAPTTDTSIILQPVVDGVTVPTFKVEPWIGRTTRLDANRRRRRRMARHSPGR
jgi:hypothetical protein